MFGGHAIKHWSFTESSISLSCGEAVFAGVIRGAGQGLAYRALLRDVGIELPLRVWTDSSAAIGICSRQGLRKLRHLDTHTLWIQQAVRTKRVDLRKVDGEKNPADLVTKHSISQQRLDGVLRVYSCRYIEGRAATAPLVRSGECSRKTMASAYFEFPIAEEEEELVERHEGSDLPIASMPHIEHSGEELDGLHPSLIPPDDEALEDTERCRRLCV